MSAADQMGGVFTAVGHEDGVSREIRAVDNQSLRIDGNDLFVEVEFVQQVHEATDITER